jgi:hypothetical protein
MDYKLEIGQQARQGDVLLLPTKKIQGEKQPKENGQVILALGESHTHCHAIAEKEADLYIQGTRKFLEVCFDKGTALKVDITSGETSTHPRHFPIILPKENYEVRIQKQWDYVKQLSQQVRD